MSINLLDNLTVTGTISSVGFIYGDASYLTNVPNSGGGGGGTSPYKYDGNGQTGIVAVSGNNTISGSYATLGGGTCNNALASCAHVGGGSCNNANNVYTTISGGYCNNVNGISSAIVGGCCNITRCSQGFIGGGKCNCNCGQQSTIVGGNSNSTYGTGSFVGGGSRNSACNTGATIVGGCSNCNTGINSFIAAGSANYTSYNNTFILGCNITSPAANYTYVNNISSQGYVCGSTICGKSVCGVLYGDGSNITGLNNIVAANSVYKTGTVTGSILPISGFNTNSGLYSTIVGGSANNVNGAAYAFILGCNITATTPNYTYVNNLSSQNAICGISLCATNSVCTQLLCATNNVCSGNVCSTGSIFGYNICGQSSVCSPSICGSNSVYGGNICASSNLCGNNICGATTICSPSICGSTSVCSPSICGSTSVCGNTICATGGFYGNGSGLTGLGNIIAANSIYKYGANSSIQPVSGYNSSSGRYSFIAAGSANNTNNKDYTFILGCNITAPTANYTYVNNICSQGNVCGSNVYGGNCVCAPTVCGGSMCGNYLCALNSVCTGLVCSTGNVCATGNIGGNNICGTTSVCTGLVCSTGYVCASNNICSSTMVSSPKICGTTSVCGATICATGGFYGDGSRITGLGSVVAANSIYGYAPNTAASVIFLSGSNSITDTASNYSVILGGCNNIISNASCSSGIVTGCANAINAVGTNHYSFIGGGNSNTISGYNSSILGGSNNCICNYIGYANISGGKQNTINTNYSNINGGSNNLIDASVCSTIAGGFLNCICNGSNNSFIGNGKCNSAICNSTYTTIVGGERNVTNNGNKVFIGNGSCNTINGIYEQADYSSVINGYNNNISGKYNFIAGGCCNDTKGFANTFILGSNLNASQANFTYVNNLSTIGTIYANNIVGPIANSPYCYVCAYTDAYIGAIAPVLGCNVIAAGSAGVPQYAVITGGYNNAIYGNNCAFIGNGSSNSIGKGCNTTVVSGSANSMSGYTFFSFIGSGYNNIIGGGGLSTCYSIIVGGCNNTNKACNSAIVGGYCNTIDYYRTDSNFIGGGFCNCLGYTGTYVVGNSIVGGARNTVSGCYSFIGGGKCNTASGNYSVILGGCNNKDNSFKNVNILGSGITATQNNTTFVENLVVSGVLIIQNSINTQSGTRYEIKNSDTGGIIASTNSSMLTAIVNGTNYPSGFQTTLLQLGSGQIYLSGYNTTVNHAYGFNKTAVPYSAATLLYTGSQWVVFGDLTS